MIRLARMNGSELWLNPVHIESVEQTPDTVITMTNGHKYLVLQTAPELAEQMREFWAAVGVVGALAVYSPSHTRHTEMGDRS